MDWAEQSVRPTESSRVFRNESEACVHADSTVHCMDVKGLPSCSRLAFNLVF